MSGRKTGETSHRKRDLRLPWRATGHIEIRAPEHPAQPRHVSPPLRRAISDPRKGERVRARLLKIGIPVLLFAACLGCYCLTLAPTITWQHDGADSGDLVTAAYTLGVAHPPGYPLFIMLARLFILLPFGEVAYRVNLMSAVLAASTAAVVYLVILALRPRDLPAPITPIIAAACALLLGLSRTFWAQAVIAEVYSLNALLVALLILFVILYSQTEERKWLWATALALGLGLSNHFSVLLFVPGTLFLILNRRRPRPAASLAAVGFFLLGLSPYLYLPLRSAQHPPLAWGAPHTWSGFWWTVSARIYAEYLMGLPLAYLPARVASWLDMLRQQFTWIGLALGLAGVWGLWEENRSWLVYSLSSFGAVVVYSVTYDTTDSYVYLIPSYVIFAVWVAHGASYLVGEIWLPWATKKRDRSLSGSRLTWLACLSLFLLPMLLVPTNLPAVNLSADREAYDYAAQVFASTPPDAVVLAATDAHVFSLWYVRYVVATEPEAVIVAEGLFQYQWYRDDLRRHHPQLIIPDGEGDPRTQVFSFLEANLPRRPIYLTDREDWILERYDLTPTGSLYKLGVKG
jgi:hypothetical protein